MKYFLLKQVAINCTPGRSGKITFQTDVSGLILLPNGLQLTLIASTSFTPRLRKLASLWLIPTHTYVMSMLVEGKTVKQLIPSPPTLA